MSNKQIITVSEAAENHICNLLQKQQDAKGLRVGVSFSGCSGISYKFEYSYDINDSDEKIHLSKALLLIDKAAKFYIIGSQLDYSSTPMKSGFIFVNPNAKNTCGCGESFSV